MILGLAVILGLAATSIIFLTFLSATPFQTQKGSVISHHHHDEKQLGGNGVWDQLAFSPTVHDLNRQLPLDLPL